MPAFLAQYPFFNLVTSDKEAATLIDTIACFATVEEREHLIPQIIEITHEAQTSASDTSSQAQPLWQGLNNLLAGYLAKYNELSDHLIIMIGEDLEQLRQSRACQVITSLTSELTLQNRQRCDLECCA